MKLIAKIFFITAFLALACKTQAQAPPPPGCFKLKLLESFNVTSKSADIKWSYCNAYVLNYYTLKYYSTDSNKFIPKIITDVIDTIDSITGLTPNTLYHYQLTMYDTNTASGERSFYKKDTFTTLNDVGIPQFNNSNNSVFNFKLLSDGINGKISLIINKDNAPVCFKIVNLTGQVVYSVTVNGEGNLTKVFDLSSLGKGIYFIKGTNKNAVKTLKFIIY